MDNMILKLMKNQTVIEAGCLRVNRRTCSLSVFNQTRWRCLILHKIDDTESKMFSRNPWTIWTWNSWQNRQQGCLHLNSGRCSLPVLNKTRQEIQSHVSRAELKSRFFMKFSSSLKALDEISQPVYFSGPWIKKLWVTLLVHGETHNCKCWNQNIEDCAFGFIFRVAMRPQSIV